jgi:hypothetical protein
MNVLLIAERANTDKWKPPRDWRTLSPEQHAKLLLALGAFKSDMGGASLGARKLEQCGLKWDAALNLCYPSKGVPWDTEQASQAALAVQGILFPKVKLVILCGARVVRAFGVPYDYVSRKWPGGPVVMQVPHPSGLCRAWNDPNTYERVRERYEAALKSC